MKVFVTVKAPDFQGKKRAIKKATKKAFDLAEKAATEVMQQRVPVDTGTLKRSLLVERTMSKDGKQEMEIGYNPEPQRRLSSNNKDYGRYVEFGTRKMSARPYMRPAGEEAEKVLQKELRKRVRRAMSGKGAK